MCLPPSFSSEGGEHSAGGADDYRVVPAFFRTYQASTHPVTACLDVSQGFGVARTELMQMIQLSFQTWESYIHEKKIDIVPSNTRIRSQVAFTPDGKCLGFENQTELTFYFGTENDTVKKYKSQYTHPFGFAQLTERGDGYSGGKGFIWISPSAGVDDQKRIPNWSVEGTRGALAGLLLHETGHVFGNGHVDGTVMTERIYEYLLNDTSEAQAGRTTFLYSKIDAQIELVPCMECRMSYRASETFNPVQVPGQDLSDWVRTFKTLTGKVPMAPIYIRFERLGNPPGSGIVTVMDANGSYHFPVVIDSELDPRTDSTPLFLGQGGTEFRSFGVAFVAHIKALTGETVPVILEYNLGNKKAMILQENTGHYPLPIFVSAD